MIHVTGDTHGTIDISKFESLQGVIRPEDFLIICGDVGVCWDGSKHDEIVQNTLLRLVPCTVLWIDGNHENFDIIENLPVTEWNGGKVQILKKRLIHLMRGEIYTIEGKTFFCFGGGQSVDKFYRVPGESWWPQEMPNQEEYDHGWNNLQKNVNKVDYIITHTAPRHICQKLVHRMYPGEEDIQNYFKVVSMSVDFKKWFFGHWHVDKVVDNKFYALYNNIEVIE